jgi:signal transduction histidine kinase
LQIINDLLDFARTKTPQKRLVNAHELIAETAGKCTVPDKVELKIVSAGTLPALNVDPLQIKQVLLNLINNGIQAMPCGGSLCVTADNHGDFTEISVVDTGEGIAPEMMQRLFQPLFTTKPKGIGLGLVVSRNLVEANGGRIEVESRQGEGTSFKVILPLARGEA